MATANDGPMGQAANGGSRVADIKSSSAVVNDSPYAPVFEVPTAPLDLRLHAVKRDYFSDPRQLTAQFWPHCLRAFLLQLIHLLPDADSPEMVSLAEQLRTPTSEHIAAAYRRQAKTIVENVISGHVKLAAPFKAVSRHGSQDGSGSWPTDIVAAADLSDSVVGMRLRADVTVFLRRFFESAGLAYRVTFNLRDNGSSHSLLTSSSSDTFKPIVVAVDAKGDLAALQARLEAEGAKIAAVCPNELPHHLIRLEPVEAGLLDGTLGSPLKEGRDADGEPL